MTEYVWEVIDGFSSNGEFSQFVNWIEKQLKEGSCDEVFIVGNTANDWQERRFRSKKTGEIWKLLKPDPGYYQGGWEPI